MLRNLVSVIVIYLLAGAAWAEGEESWELLGPLVVEELDNGMTFLLYPNRRAPIFSGVIRFDVGGKDETPGQTGVSHMFEHMAFKGTRQIGTKDHVGESEALRRVEEMAWRRDRARNEARRASDPTDEMQAQLAALEEKVKKAQEDAARFVVKDEFDEIYNREGGAQLNATTSSDATTYFISLPANRLPLWTRMESDRLLMPVMREFYQERDVVMEERRMRRDNSPVGQLWEITMATAYQAHPYAYPVIGWEDDIINLKASLANEFYRRHYTPDRAVGVLVGDFDVEATRALLRETFGRIPPADEQAGHQRIVPEPPQRGERRVNLELPATPALLMAWHKPQAPDPADVAAEVLMQVLAGGRSARWFEKFVKEERLAADIYTFTGPGDHEPNLFMIYATPQGEHTLEELEAAIRSDVAELAREPLGEDELARAKKSLRADAIRALKTNLGLAQQLATSFLIGGDPYYLERRLRQLEAVTADEIMSFIDTFLQDSNLTVGTLRVPAEGEEAG